MAMVDFLSRKTFSIDGVTIGAGQRCYVIAEMSGNHDGDLNEAINIIRAAKASGADAVKLQTYRADTITLNSMKEDFRLPVTSSWGEYETLYSLYEKASTPWEWHAELFDEARRSGITIFSSPFDLSAVELLEELDAPAYKIASPEISDIPLIRRVAQTAKPVILSTGLADLDDITLAVDTLRQNGCEDFAILRCTTAYPAPVSETNLALLPDMAKRFDCVVGLSDHSIGQVVPLAAVHHGAKILEKHFVLNRSGSVDGFFSMDQQEFRDLIENLEATQAAIGGIDYSITPTANNNKYARRSLYVADDVKKGELITEENIRSVRPGFGLHPKYYEEVLGKTFARNRTLGDRLLAEDVDGFDLDVSDFTS